MQVELAQLETPRVQHLPWLPAMAVETSLLPGVLLHNANN